MIKISIIIPTFNRLDVISKTLLAIDHQNINLNQIETIIVDDGSEKVQLNRLKHLVKNIKVKTRFYTQKHKGPATARNFGIKKAIGNIVLIINDDTVPTPNLIKRHLLFHKRHPKINHALLGLVSWHPDLDITPFMIWLENGGPYFSYDKIRGKDAGWQRFWTCNISLKKEFLINKGMFDESFPNASWEDIELGYRLSLSKLILSYDRQALGYHYHSTSFNSIRNKMLANGRNLVLIRQKMPPKYWPPLAKYP